MRIEKTAVAVLASLFVAASGGQALAQTVTPLTNQPSGFVGIAFLMTDGTVMAQAGNGVGWFRLTPDDTGSYAAGTWHRVASIPAAWGYSPSAFASAVLADGRLLILGGEYNAGAFALTNLGGIYDPVADAWSQLAAPPGWDYIGDSPSTVLPGGQFLIGRKLDEQVAMLDPTTMQWTLMGTTGKSDFNAEEGWTLMPDGSVLTVDVLHAPNSERYVPSLGQWLGDASTIVDLHEPPSVKGIKYGGGVYHPPGEVGPLILRPDGSVLATGGASATGGHTAVYTPGPGLRKAGSWTPGPDFPSDDAGDASAVLLPSGNVAVIATSGTIYEFDGKTLKAGPTGAAGGLMLMLPSGEALLTGLGQVSLYSSAGQPDPAWAPTISSVPTVLTRGTTASLTGTQLNGLSQAQAFGDEYSSATNYPLVRITNVASGHVVYARTHDHSSMGVATGSLAVTTSFDVPRKAERGASTLEVVANGIASTPVSVRVK